MKKSQQISWIFVSLALIIATGRCWPSDLIPADRLTIWNPGMNSLGGIPNRTTISTTINAATYGNGTADATAAIQTAINNCPVGQVVMLSAGTFTINNDIIYVNKGITLRGAGAKMTTLQRTNGATPGTYIPGVAKPVIIVGPSRWGSGGSSYALAADAVKGTYSLRLTVAPAGGFLPGQIVQLDELSGAAWRSDPEGRGQIWASADFRVVYQRHNPSQGTDDPWPEAAGWFCRQDRPTSELKEVQSYDSSTRTITFTSPFHIDYRTANTAQVFVYAVQDTHVKYAGVEDLLVKGGDDGQLRFQWAAYSWAARVENTAWLGEGFAVNQSFRVEIRDSFVHTPVWFEPGGGSYNISLANGSSEILIENNISTDADKVMVARCAGAGSVVGYNYMDDGHIGSSPTWVEIGLNASHMVGPHHMLFEGNYCFNADSDHTHGNSILHTYFRNHLSGQRRSFTDGGPRRCVGLMAFSYWMSFVGNVLGRPGQMSGWMYESQDFGDRAIWMLGWDGWSPYPSDPNIVALTYRHGNFDYLTNTQKWDPTVTNHTLPDSLYLTSKPAFFGSRTWPWVQPEGTTKLFSLPAKDRFDGVQSPSIIGQPLDRSVAVGQTATFTVTASGTPAPTYQWRKNGVNISGATSASYTTPATVMGDQGSQFSVVVTNTVGSVISGNATLTVNAATSPLVVTPATASAITDTHATVSVLGGPAGSEPGYLYTWSVVSGPVGEATIFTPNGTNPAKNSLATFTRAGTYSIKVVIANPANSTMTTSGPITVTIAATLTSIMVAGPASVSMGTTGQFTAAARDQFALPLSNQPAITWTATGGSITTSGLYTAGSSAGSFQITASAGGKSTSAAVTVTSGGGATGAKPGSGGGCGSGAGLASLVVMIFMLGKARGRRR